MYKVAPRSPFALAAAGCMAVSAVLRVAAYARYGAGQSAFHLATQLALPLVCNLLYLYAVLRGGRHARVLEIAAVVAGVLFFIIKAFSFVWWHQLLCTLLYLLVAVIYVLTVTGKIPTKLPLTLVFALPLCFHLGEDLLNALRRAPHMDTRAWILEVSVLFIMASLLCATISMKREPAPGS